MTHLSRRTMLGAAIGSGAILSAGAAQADNTVRPAPPWTEQGYVQRAGGAVHWVAMGKGPPVVLIAKLGGWVADWRHVAPLLADRFQVIAIDAPGHGGSRMATPAPFIHTLPESAAMIRSALSELGIDRFALVGNSLGGCIGIAMAALFPQDVTHLVALSATLAAGVAWRDISEIDRDAPPGNFDADWNPLPRPLEEMNRRFGLTREIHDEMNASRAMAGKWIRASERGVFVADMPSFLPRIKAKTLLIYGSTGPYPRHRETGLRLIPDAQAVTIADGGSFVHQQRPQETAAALTRFLSQ